MARGFVIPGVTLVKVKGLGMLSESQDRTKPSLRELGLAAEKVEILPRWKHEDQYVDDFGPNVPAEVHTMLAEVTVRMTLIHYDPDVLEACVCESQGGELDGIMAPPGRPLGGGVPLQTPGNHYISLGLISQFEDPYRFRASYLTTEPLSFPLGTETSAVSLSWRALPYVPALAPPDAALPEGDGWAAALIAAVLAAAQAGTLEPQELIAAGARLWDRELDAA